MGHICISVKKKSPATFRGSRTAIALLRIAAIRTIFPLTCSSVGFCSSTPPSFVPRGRHRSHPLPLKIMSSAETRLLYKSVFAEPSGRTVEYSKRDAGEQSASTRVRQNFRSHRHVSGSFRVPAFRTGRCRCICAKFHLAAENSLRTPLVHHQQNKIRGAAADLEPKAAAFECHHAGRAPRPAEIVLQCGKP